MAFAMIMTGLNAEAQTAEVNSQDALVAALQDEDMRQLIKLTDNIRLTTTVTIPAGVTTQINLNGFIIDRGLTESAANGQVFHVSKGAKLTLSGLRGVITGGYAENGGAILNEGELTIYDITISGNHAAKNGGAIWNSGTLTLEGTPTLTDNSAVEGGGLYNSQNASCTIDGVSITSNTVSGKGGGIANYGAITFLGGSILSNQSTLDGGGVYIAKDASFAMKGGEIKYNKSSTNFTSGIYVGGALEMKGSVVVTDNHMGNVTLPGLSFIKVTGAFEEYVARIGVSCETSGVITNGFAAHNPNLDFANVFFSDLEGSTLSSDGGEVALTNSSSESVEFYHAQWDEESKEVKYMKKYSGAAYPLTNQTSLSGWYVVNESYTNSSSRVTINDDTNIILQDGATLTLEKGIYVKDGKTLTIYGQQEGTGHLKCSAGSYNAGIGGNRDVVAGYVVIHGGKVTASGDDDGAGIGGGYGDGSGIRGITIYGGTIKASGMNGGAGIGKGKNNNVWEDIRIYGGKIEAIGGYLGAGIGGSYNRGNGNIWIYGGNIEAYVDLNGMLFNIWMEKHGGTGIGGGREANQDRPINIYGGTIYAKGIGGAGIGGGSYGNGGEINIYGGNVTAMTPVGGRGAGIGGGNEGKGGRVYIADEATVFADKGWVESSPIGHGKDNSDNGTLKLGDNLMAYYLSKADDSKDFYLSSERVSKCSKATSIYLTKCTHPSGFTYTVDGDNHTAHCKHCLYTETHEHEFSAESGECICGLKNSENTLCEITIATVNGSNTNYEAVVSGGVVKDQPFTIPSCDREPDGYVFAGWLVTDTNADPPQELEAQPGEELLQPGDTYTPTGNIMLWARYDGILLELDANDTATSTIEEFAGRKAATVWLKNRTFYTDGYWNTLCLPFDILDFTGTPLEGATVKTLVSSSFDSSKGTLTLNFGDDLKSIEAGKPYLVKWTNSSYSSINYPAFDFGNITIRADLTAIPTDEVVFRGHFNKIGLTKGDTSVLFMGAENTLYYPNDDMSVKGFSCVFELREGLVAGDLATGQTNVSNFKLNFGDGSDVTGVTLPLINQSGAGDEMWYDLQGRRLSGKPTAKGMYITNGKKVVIQ